MLAVLHPPTATHARIMEQAGCEAGFVGTSGVVGSYTGLSDVGTATMTECVQIAGWIAQSVSFPVIMDGDTGHGGIMAVRRMVRECIRAGIAGMRIDDQPIEGKRRTQSAGVEVVPLEQAIARYRAAVDMKNELDPGFRRDGAVLRARRREQQPRGLHRGGSRPTKRRPAWTGCSSNRRTRWTRSSSARAAVKGPLSFMKGKLPRYLGLDEHLALGINIAWYPGFTHQVMWAALWDFMQDFQQRGMAAWEDFQASRKDRPYPRPEVGPEGEGGGKAARAGGTVFFESDARKIQASGDHGCTTFDMVSTIAIVVISMGRRRRRPDP